MINLELHEALLSLDEYVFDQLQNPNKDATQFFKIWNEYQKRKRYLKLVILHIANNQPFFDWKWLHEQKLLNDVDYQIFKELAVFPKPEKNAFQALQEAVNKLK